MNEPTVFSEDQDYFVKNLRQETSESHQKLEDNRLSKAILDPSVSIVDYQQYLSKMYGVTTACEAQIFPAVAHILPDLAERYKSSLIIKDLAATGLESSATDALPVYTFNFATAEEAMGILYVIEGSTLGGRILYRHIHETLGYTPENGAAYFWGYGSDTGKLWKSFISSLTNFAAETGDSYQIIESAKKTFTIIDHWLSSSN